MPTTECPPGKILNPASGRCVDENGKIGRALRGGSDREECPPGKIRNPTTGRCVDENGKIGMEVRGLTSPASRPPPAVPTVNNITNMMEQLQLRPENEAIGYSDDFVGYVRDNSQAFGPLDEAAIRYAANFATKYVSAILHKARQLGAVERHLTEAVDRSAPDVLRSYLRSELRRNTSYARFMTFRSGLSPGVKAQLSSLVFYITMELVELGQAHWQGSRNTSVVTVNDVRAAIDHDVEFKQVRRALSRGQ